MSATTHDDLMDIASRYAYEDLSSKPEKSPYVYVNGTRYKIQDAHHDPVSGLDAFTLKNLTTGEVAVAFQGSAGDVDWQNNAVLVTSATPAQFHAAEAYVNNVGGRVDFVCGNSLGGGLAAYVGGRNPDIQAVTVNPAPVPAGLAGADAPNVRNYIVDNDMLHQLVVVGGLGNRVIGETTVVAGTHENDVFGPNHVGSDRTGGQYDASMAVPFSLFHQDAVVSAGSFGALVDITAASVEQMTVGLRAQRADLMTIVDEELARACTTLEAHAAEIHAREQHARQTLVEVFESGYAPTRWLIDRAQDVVAAQKSALHAIPCPAVLSPFWRVTSDALLDGTDQALQALEEIGAFAARAAAEGAWLVSCPVFTDASQHICDGLIRQSKDLRKDVRLVDGKWDAFVGLSSSLAREITRVDVDVAAAIASRGCLPDAVPSAAVPWPDGKARGVTEGIAQSFCQKIVDLRTEVASVLLAAFASSITASLAAPAAAMWAADMAMELIEATVCSALSGLSSAIEHAEGAVVAQVAGVSDDLERFRRAVQELGADCRRCSDEVQDILRAVRKVLDALPDLVLSTKPQIESLIFPDQQIQLAYDSFSKCRNLADRSALAFREVDYQLSEHRATAIDALSDRAGEVGSDIDVVSGSLVEMLT